MAKCTQCNQDVGETPYNPMEEWKIKSPLCGKCYSSKLEEFYPGNHVRLNRMDEDEKKRNLRD